MTVPQNSTAQVQQWQQRLLYTVAGLLLFETLTGFAIYLLPFSVANQVMVLLHTIVGLVVLLPYAWYQLRHWRTYRALRLSHVKLTGYCTMAATIAAAVSGLVFTIQAIAATRISRGWDIAHVVATFALVAAALPHIVTLVVRASRTRDTTSGAQLLAAARWCGARTLLLTVGLFVIVAGVAALYRPTKLVNELPADYSYVYGAKNIFTENLTNQIGYKERVSCVACQAIKETDVKGNAAYVIAQPKRYLFELEDANTRRIVSDFLICSYPRYHIESLQHKLFKSPEFCAACHKQFIDKEINQVGWVQLQNQFDAWRKNRWNHPDDPTGTVECRECHMPLSDSSDPASGDDRDYNRTPSDGKHRSHRFLAANQFMPLALKLPDAAEHTRPTEQWLRGEIEIPEIASKWRKGPAVPVEVMAPDQVRSGDPVKIDVRLTNNKVGHDFPTGPLDIIQAWVAPRPVMSETGSMLSTLAR